MNGLDGVDFSFAEKAALERHRAELLLGKSYVIVFEGMVQPKIGNEYGAYSVFRNDGENPTPGELQKIGATRNILSEDSQMVDQAEVK